MTESALALAIEDHVAHIRFRRGDALNTMVPAFWREMVEVFAEIDRTPAVRAVVISASGRHFTAGLDLAMLDEIAGSDTDGDRARAAEQLRRLVLDMQHSFTVVDRCRVPVVAAIQGACIGGGVDLVSACDMRLCTSDAFFCIQEINIAITADVGTLQRLPHLIPDGMVRELAYTGRRLAADEAKAIGLVNGVYPTHEELLAAAMETAGEIASKSPLAVAGTKRMLDYARDHTVADGLDYVATWQAGMLLGPDITEQMHATKEGRAPDFADLLPTKRTADG